MPMWFSEAHRALTWRLGGSISPGIGCPQLNSTPSSKTGSHIESTRYGKPVWADQRATRTKACVYLLDWTLRTIFSGCNTGWIRWSLDQNQGEPVDGLTTPLMELHNSKSLMHLTCQVCNYFHCIVLVRVTDDKRLLHMYAHKLSRPLAVEPSNVLAHKIVKTSVLRFCTRQDLASKTFPGWAPGCAIVQWCNTECGYSNCSPVQAVTGKKNLGKFGKTKKLETLFFFLTRALSSFPVLDCPSLFYIESCMRKVHAWMCTIHHKGPSLRDGRPPENLWCSHSWALLAAGGNTTACVRARLGANKTKQRDFHCTRKEGGEDFHRVIGLGWPALPGSPPFSHSEYWASHVEEFYILLEARAECRCRYLIWVVLYQPFRPLARSRPFNSY